MLGLARRCRASALIFSIFSPGSFSIIDCESTVIPGYSICWQRPVGPSDSDTGLSQTLYLSSHNPFRRPCHTTLTSYHPAAGGDSYLAGEAGVPAQTKGSIFIVPKKDGGQRPVINLKMLNYHVKSEHFKMEILHTVKSLPKKEDCMTKVDLKDAFFMVPMVSTLQLVWNRLTLPANTWWDLAITAVIGEMPCWMRPSQGGGCDL